MADNRKLAQGLMMMTPAMRADLAGREQDIQRGKTVELLRRAGKEMYENPIVNTAIGLSPGAGDVQAGYEAIRSAQQGNYGEAGLNALGVLPFIPALGGITKNIKPETLEQLGKYFDESAIEAIKAPLNYKSRQTTVLMNPNEFLAYAAKDAPNKLKAAEIEQKFAEGSKLAEGNIPQLWFDQQGNVASITGHEGRHRARYLQEQGVELMPVNVKSSNIRWSEQVEPNRFDYVQEWPQTLQNQDLTMNTPFPLTREGEYVSSMDKQQAMHDPFWREEAKLPKPDKAEIDALAAEFEDYYKNSNQPVAQALRNYAPKIDEATGLPLNEQGMVTVYHHTNPKAAKQIAETGRLRSAGESDVYVTSWDKPDTGYGEAVVPIQVDPSVLRLDDEFPSGRMDFAIPVGKSGEFIFKGNK